METRPFYKRVASLFRRDPRLPVPTDTDGKVTHEYPLPSPKSVVKVNRIGRGKPRNPVIRQQPSTDPRFNHTLRRMLRKE